MNISRFKISSLVTVSLVTLPWLAACSAENPTTDNPPGGSQGSGGSVVATSGGQGMVGSGGGAPLTSGGAPSSGGATVTQGGSTSGGAPSAGAPSAGASSGGAAQAGGGASAGNATTGGSTSGGAQSAGAPSAGATSSGGSSGGGSTSGGAPSAGAPSAGAPSAGATSSGGSSGGSGGGDKCNAVTTLAPYAPKDAELAEMFGEYLGAEVGPLTCATSAPAGTSRTISQTIFVPPGVVYDGKGETLKADATAMKCDLTAGEQAESQRPFFLLAPGASVKNVTLAYPGCEGIHMMGDNVLDNISWPDAGEDAASVRSYFPGGKITISNSNGHKAADKMFQFNAPCNVLIQNFTGSDMGKLVRQNGDTTFELHVDLNNVTVTGVISAVVQSDSPLCYIRHHNLSYQFTGSGDKSDRVFRDVPPANVTQY